MLSSMSRKRVNMRRIVLFLAAAVAALTFTACPNPGPGPSLDYTSANVGRLVYIPAGTFQRDAVATNTSTVSVFRIGQKEITRAQYLAIIGSDPSNVGNSSGTGDPVQMVSWHAALVFCNKLSVLEGLTPVYSISGSTNTDAWGPVPPPPPGSSNPAWDAATADSNANGYRLPTEMEWLWAAMGASGGTTGYSKLFAGSTGSNDINEYAWYGAYTLGTSASPFIRTAPAGSMLPNEIGLLDMSGNVWEWCWDWHGVFPTGEPDRLSRAVFLGHRPCLAWRRLEQRS
jgi:formylglycine-generating enzyme